ncbi:MAG: hypothetical protein LBD07_00525 [Spirochaetaceae bacterium]|jgi:hypothetical protein|nr:hypothetical protein [Spirochaetaceae bacterium]
MASIEIRNCGVFDGKNMTGMEKLVIENGVIFGKTSGEVSVDGGGGAPVFRPETPAHCPLPAHNDTIAADGGA